MIDDEPEFFMAGALAHRADRVERARSRVVRAAVGQRAATARADATRPPAGDPI
jgi:hypothetical protein